MAMVTITRNGKNYLRVSKSAFNELYKRQGFRVAGTEEIKQNKAKKNEDTLTNEEDNSGKPQEDGEGKGNPSLVPEDDGEEGTQEEDGEEEKSLEEKTFKEMSLEELQEYAKINGIDIEGLTEKKEIRKAIKAALNN